MRQASAKRKSALHKSDLAGAALQDALLKARLCRLRAKRAQHVLEAANAYIKHVRWTVQQSKCKSTSILSKRRYRVTTVAKPGLHGIQRTQLFLWNEHN